MTPDYNQMMGQLRGSGNSKGLRQAPRGGCSDAMSADSQGTKHARHIALIAWVVLATVLWLFKGWGIDVLTLGRLIQPSEPGLAKLRIISFGAGLLLFGTLVLSGLPFAIRHMRSASVPRMLALAFVTGMVASGTLYAFAAFKLIAMPLSIGLSVLIAAVGVFALRRTRCINWHERRRAPLSPEAVATSFIALVVGVATLAPSVESDGLRYHLVAVQEWLRVGKFVNIPFNANSNLPSIPAIITAGWGNFPNLFQQIQWAGFIASVIFAGAFAEQVFRSLIARRDLIECGSNSSPAKSAMLIVAGIPALGLVSSWPFTDSASLAPLIAAAWVFTPGSFRSRTVRIATGALLVGGAIATKISNLPIAGMLCVYALLSGSRFSAARFLREALIIGGIVMVVMAPWLVKNWSYHHNPVYPLAYGIFGGPEWSPENDAFYKAKLAEKGLGHSLTYLLRAPYDVTMLANSPVFEHQNPGPGFLAFLPISFLAGGLALRRRRVVTPATAALLIVLISFAVWFKTYQSARFLIPTIVLAVVLGTATVYAFAARAGTPALRITRWCLGIAGIVSVAWLPTYLLASTRVLQTAVGLHSEDVFINSRFPTYSVIQWLNNNTQQNEPVFYIGEFRAAHADHFKPIASDWFDTPRVLVEIRATKNNDALLARWREQGIRYVLMNLKELGFYEAVYFRPRFTGEEWKRFVALRASLLQRVVYDNSDGIFVASIHEAGGSAEKTGKPTLVP